MAHHFLLTSSTQFILSSFITTFLKIHQFLFEAIQKDDIVLFLYRNQLNQKLKLIVGISEYDIYSNTPPQMRVIWAKTVNVAQAHFILGAKCSTLNEW